METKPKIVAEQGLSGLEDIVYARGLGMKMERKVCAHLNRAASVAYMCT